MDYFFVLLFLLLAVVFVVGGLGVSRIFAPRNPGLIKSGPCGCGQPPIGPAWIQFNVGYYLFGLLFLVFDVEAAFLYPWAVAFRDVGLVGLLEVGVFLLVLFLG